MLCLAAPRRKVRAALARAVQLMGELGRAGQSERFGPVVLYVIHTQDDETLREFEMALQREVRGPGGDMATYGEKLIEEGRLEGRQEGRVATIESFLRAGVGWSMITQATGIDQEAFELLRRQTDPADREC